MWPERHCWIFCAGWHRFRHTGHSAIQKALLYLNAGASTSGATIDTQETSIYSTVLILLIFLLTDTGTDLIKNAPNAKSRQWSGIMVLKWYGSR
jgi:hypothetical protein